MIFESKKAIVKEKDDLIKAFFAKGGKVNVIKKVNPYEKVDSIIPVGE